MAVSHDAQFEHEQWSSETVFLLATIGLATINRDLLISHWRVCGCRRGLFCLGALLLLGRPRLGGIGDFGLVRRYPLGHCDTSFPGNESTVSRGQNSVDLQNRSTHHSFPLSAFEKAHRWYGKDVVWGLLNNCIIDMKWK